MIKTYMNPEKFLDDYLSPTGKEKFADRVVGTDVFSFSKGARAEGFPFSSTVIPHAVVVYADEDTLQEVVDDWRTQDAPMFMPMIVDSGCTNEKELAWYSRLYTDLVLDMLKMTDVAWGRKVNVFRGILNSLFLRPDEVTDIILDGEVLKNLSFAELVNLSSQSDLTLEQAREVVKCIPEETLRYPGGLVLINPESQKVLFSDHKHAAIPVALWEYYGKPVEMICGYNSKVNPSRNSDFFEALCIYAMLDQGKLAYEMWEAVQRANSLKSIDDWHLHSRINSIDHDLKNGEYIYEFSKGWMWLGLRAAAADFVKDPDMVDQAVDLAGTLAQQHKLGTGSKRLWETVLAALT